MFGTTTQLLPVLTLLPNANAQGEFLRNVVFDQSLGEFGCYQTFETNPDLTAGDQAWREKFWQLLGYQNSIYPTNGDDIIEMAQMGNGGELVFADCIVHACWFWDGDGCLAFIVFDLTGSVIFELINTDCKKDYIWK